MDAIVTVGKMSVRQLQDSGTNTPGEAIQWLRSSDVCTEEV
jgi:hypothetical protein